VDEKLANIDRSVTDLKRDVKDTVSEVKGSVEALGVRIMESLQTADRCGKTEHGTMYARIASLESNLAYLKTKVALFAGIAGVIGGALTSALFNAIARKLLGS